MSLIMQRLLNRRRAERVSQDRTADRYRFVLIFRYANGPMVVSDGIETKAAALAKFARHLRMGGLEPGSHRRALVMTDADYRHMAGGAR